MSDTRADDNALPPDELPAPELKKARKFTRPEHVRGIYLTAWTAGLIERRDSLIKLVNDTELNAMVVDIRDTGTVFWRTGIKDIEESKAQQVAVTRPEEFMDLLEKNDIYPIARIACFLDDYVTVKYPDRAVQTEDGKIWRDRAKHAWLDPYNKKNWELIADLTTFAMDLGFQEIQLDYVRFPSEGKVTSTVYPAKKDWPDKEALPGDVIVAFGEYIRKKVKARNLEISADVFGIISSGGYDQGIGQTLDKISAPFDVICPMIYPSHFAKGEYGVKEPNKSPYDITYKSLRDYRKKLPEMNVRPWLQDFSIYGVTYGKKEVQDQILAAKEHGYEEYLLWNPRNRYTEDAVKDNSKLLAEKIKKDKASGKKEVVSGDEPEASEKLKENNSAEHRPLRSSRLIMVSYTQ